MAAARRGPDLVVAVGLTHDPALQGGQYHPVGRFEVRAVYLSAQHRDLVTEDQEFDVFGAAIAGELGQHLQHLAYQQVHQRSAHGRDRRSCLDDLAQNRTSRPLNRFYEPDRL